MPTPPSNLTVCHDIGSGKHRQLINLSDLAVSLEEDYCATLLGMYVFSGEDCASAFKGNREGGARDKSWRSTPGFIKRSGLNLKYHVLKQLEEFTCLMYGTASLRWTPCVPNSCARSWLRTRNSLPNLRSTWFAFLPATLL